MKFSDLPIGAKYRLHKRGPENVKTSENTYSSEVAGVRDQPVRPEVEVIYEKPGKAKPPEPEVPTGQYNRVEFVKGTVRLDGTFTLEQLEAVLDALKKRKR